MRACVNNAPVSPKCAPRCAEEVNSVAQLGHYLASSSGMKAQTTVGLWREHVSKTETHQNTHGAAVGVRFITKFGTRGKNTIL